MQKVLLIGIVMIIFVLPIFTSAATYYIDSTEGNDDNDGLSPTTAWKTITKVNNELSARTFKPGDSILFKRGDKWTSGNNLQITQGGATDQPLTIGAYGTGNKPVFYGGTHIICTTDGIGYITVQDIRVEKAGTGSSLYFRANNMNNITISRVEVIGSEQNAIFLASVSGYLIEDCYVDYAANSGIVIYGSTTTPPINNGIIRNNLIEGSGGNDCFTLHKDGNGNDIGSHHLLIKNVGHNCGEQAFDITAGKDIILRDNEGYDNADSSIIIGHSAENVWIDRFYSHDERQMGIIITEAINSKVTNSIFYKAGYHQIQVGSASGTVNTEIYNNIFVHGPDSTGSILDISYPTTNKVVFKNNIIMSMQYDQPARYVRYLGGATPNNTNSVFSNNIWWRPDGAATGDNRMWYDGTDVHTFDWWQTLYPTEKLADPQVVDITNGNLKLQSTSPAIDTGANTGLTYDFENNPRPQGSAPDIGAYEYQGSAPPVCAAADINCDTRVDISDLILITRDFGKTSGYNLKADTDSNGIIDIFDIVYVASRFT